MNKTLVLYFSNYGTTKKYAEWIAEELTGDLFDIKNVKNNCINEYSTIILGSGLYAGKIKGINLLVNNYEIIKDKKLVLFTCGLADYNKKENIDNIYKRLVKVIPKELPERLKMFYLRGGINYKGLGLKHKVMMGMLKYMVLKRGLDKTNEENQEFIETYGQTLDFTKKENIRGIIEYCNN
jgi:menaquinone-dependent protoporphyrinogen IX oxidase